MQSLPRFNAEHLMHHDEQKNCLEMADLGDISMIKILLSGSMIQHTLNVVGTHWK